MNFLILKNLTYNFKSGGESGGMLSNMLCKSGSKSGGMIQPILKKRPGSGEGGPRWRARAEGRAPARRVPGSPGPGRRGSPAG